MNRTPPILFIPGWAATDQAWSAVRSRLAGVRTHDLGWVAAQRDEAAVRTILAREPEPWLLVGWSLGALLALRAALASPARLRGLILISGTARICAAGAAYSGADPRALRAMRTRLPRDPERVLRDFAERCVAPEGGTEVRAQFLAQARRFPAAELALGLDSLATLDLRAQAARLAVPTLLVHGACDMIVPLQCARALAAGAPGARLEILENHGHALPWTAPAAIAQFIRSFAA